jgi:TfoX/Sxy family transcriptional regulator of competence genes
MAYDEALAVRVRRALRGRRGLAEKKMFGGVAFLLDGNMCCAITGAELIVRVGAQAVEAALREPHTSVLDMSGRPMKGWVVVNASGLAGDDSLARWVRCGAAYAAGLPPK